MRISAFAPALRMSISACAGFAASACGLRAIRRPRLSLREWLKARPEVARVIHPALPSDPGHAIWKRDFTGASGLFAIVLKPASKGACRHARRTAAVRHGLFLGGLREPDPAVRPADYRTATTWQAEGPALRLHVGLEDVDDLKADLDAGFARLAAHR